MKRRDRSQYVVLLALGLLGVLIVAGVFFGGGRAKAGKGREAGARRVSLMEDSTEFDGAFVLARPLDVARIAEAHRFDFPLGSENGAMSYDAQPFLENRHLGADFNGIGGWDSDRGDPAYAVAEGRVLFAGWAGDGWGNLVMLGHRLPGGQFLQTVYGHLEAIDVAIDDRVHRGRRIGSVGKGAGQYLAHLHFEVRSNPSLNPGLGYADGPLDRLAPTAFLDEHRGAAPDALSGAPGGGKSPAGGGAGPGLRFWGEGPGERGE